MKTSKELKQKIKSIINQLPDEIEGRCPYELMIYTTYEEGQSDLEEFYKFNGIKEIDKAIDNIINQYKETLYCIDFKFSEEEGVFDQFTIYKN
jgi:hypothetical protein